MWHNTGPARRERLAASGSPISGPTENGLEPELGPRHVPGERRRIVNNVRLDVWPIAVDVFNAPDDEATSGHQ